MALARLSEQPQENIKRKKIPEIPEIPSYAKIFWFAMQNDHRVLYQLLKKDNEKPTLKQILGNHVPKTFTARRWHSGHKKVI